MDSLRLIHPTPTKENKISLRLCVLGSGSKGNAIYLRSGDTSILIDAGLSARQICLRLASINVDIKEINAILITHEHRDHLSGVKVLSKSHLLPVFFNRPTWEAASELLGNKPKIEFFENSVPFSVGDLTIEAFSISHDAADPVGFVIHSKGYKTAIATDLGYASTLVKEKLKGAHLLVLEANHDLEMLKNGPYPWDVKQRVWGRQGHLSNEDSGELLREVNHPDLAHVVLAHVSETNNQERLVLQMVKEVLSGAKADYSVAQQHTVGRQIHLT